MAGRSETKPNILLLACDTLGAAHMGCYGYHRDTCPNIGRLADRGVLFENVYPSDVPTEPSYTAMLSGQRGITTGVVTHDDAETIPFSTPWLPSILSDSYTTCAVTTLNQMKKDLTRGFCHVVDPAYRPNRKRDPKTGKRGMRRADAFEINELVISWLRSLSGERFFLFVHYWDPHTPYLPPDEYRYRWYDGDPADPSHHFLEETKKHLDSKYPPTVAQRLSVSAKMRMSAGSVGVNTNDIEWVVAQHDAEISYLDDQIAKLLEAFEEMGLVDKTLIILTGDHGECIYEHDCFSDHGNVYEPTIRVPLIMVLPETLPRRKKIGSFVQQIDILPTVMDLLNMRKPQATGGESLLPLVYGDTEKIHDCIICSQGLWQASRAIRIGDWKFIDILERGFWGPDSAYELYDLGKDPDEENNLIETEPEMAERLQIRLDRWVHEHVAKRQDRIDPLRTALRRPTSPLASYNVQRIPHGYHPSE